MCAFTFQACRLGPGRRINVDHTFLKQVIEEKPNGG
jgi:hypothetical protein